MKTGQPQTFLRDFSFTHPSMSQALNDLIFEHSIKNPAMICAGTFPSLKSKLVFV